MTSTEATIAQLPELAKAITTNDFDHIHVHRYKQSLEGVPPSKQPDILKVTYRDPNNLVWTDASVQMIGGSLIQVEMQRRVHYYVRRDTMHTVVLTLLGQPISPVTDTIDPDYNLNPVAKGMLETARKGVNLFTMAYKPLRKGTFDLADANHDVRIINSVEPGNERPEAGTTIMHQTDRQIALFNMHNAIVRHLDTYGVGIESQ